MCNNRKNPSSCTQNNLFILNKRHFKTIYNSFAQNLRVTNIVKTQNVFELNYMVDVSPVVKY